jgi:hypothetical protein
MNKPTLVLDLDDVFLHHPERRSSECHPFFEGRYLLVKCNEYQYVTPAYTCEFLEFARDNFEIAFFSGGDETRNVAVVGDMWTKTFGSPKPDDVKILSSKDRKNVEYCRPADLFQPKSTVHYGTDLNVSWYGNTKKDLSLLGDLANTVLADDDKSYVMKGQVKNFLSVPGGNLYDLKRVHEYYEPKGEFDALFLVVRRS